MVDVLFLSALIIPAAAASWGVVVHRDNMSIAGFSSGTLFCVLAYAPWAGKMAAMIA